MAYIDAEKLKSNIRVNLMSNVDIDGTVTVENAERYFLNLIDKTSTADVVEVKYGYWIEVSHTGNSKKGRHIKYTTKKCSVCGYCNGRRKTKRCPNCGAKMDGGKAE